MGGIEKIFIRLEKLEESLEIIREELKEAQRTGNYQEIKKENLKYKWLLHLRVRLEKELEKLIK